MNAPEVRRPGSRWGGAVERLPLFSIKDDRPGRATQVYRPCSETVGLTVRSQQTITILLGSCHAGQDPFRVQRYPVLEIDSD